MSVPKFFEKRWVRIIGLLPMTLYCFLVFIAVSMVLDMSFLRDVNQVFPGTDLIGMLGYFFFLGIVFGSGILAVVTAYFLKGVFRILYLAGSLAIISAVTYIPLAIAFSPNYVLRPEIPEFSYFVGEWVDRYYMLNIDADSSYQLYTRKSLTLLAQGKFQFDDDRIEFKIDSSEFQYPFRVVKSEGYYFIRYDIPENPDAWSGNLGLMRLVDWEATH